MFESFRESGPIVQASIATIGTYLLIPAHRRFWDVVELPA
jgi:hypothetical protein